MALWTKGITLTYDVAANDETGSLNAFSSYAIALKALKPELVADDVLTFPDLIDIGELNISGAGGSYDQIEITTLADNKHKYMDGLIADGENAGNEIAFTFLYEKSLFTAFNEALRNQETYEGDNHDVFKIVIPNGNTFQITADIASLALNQVNVNEALKFVVSLAIRDITVI